MFGLVVAINMVLSRLGRRGAGAWAALVGGGLEDMAVVTLLHEELSKVDPAVEDTVEGSVGGMGERAACMGTPEARLVVALSLQCHLLQRIHCLCAHCALVLRPAEHGRQLACCP